MKNNLVAAQEEIDNLHSSIANLVKKHRIEKNVSQLDLATTIGFSSSTFFGNAEAYREKKHFNVEHLYLISKVLQINIKDLFPNSEEVAVNVCKNSDKKMLK